MKRVSRFIIATLSAAIILFSNADDVIANEKMVIVPAVCESLPDTIPCGKVLSDSIGRLAWNMATHSRYQGTSMWISL